MERTVTIKNVQATEAELRAALKQLEKPDPASSPKLNFEKRVASCCELTVSGKSPATSGAGKYVWIRLDGSCDYGLGSGWGMVTSRGLTDLIETLAELRSNIS